MNTWRLRVSILGFGVFLTAACGNNATEDQREAPRTLRVIFPQHEADTAGILPQLVQSFEAANNVTVDLTQGTWDEIAAIVQPAVQAGSDQYDVVELDNGWVAEFGQRHYLQPLNTYAGANYTADLIQGNVDLFTWSGDLLGLVWNNDIRFPLYRKDVLTAAGISSPPTTMEELRTDCLKIVASNPNIHCMAEAWGQDWPVANDLHFWVYSFGGGFVDSAFHVTMDQDTNTHTALKYMVDMLHDGFISPSSVTMAQSDQADDFVGGHAAFLLQAWNSVYADAQNPSKSSVKDEVAIGLVPGQVPGQGAAIALPEALAIPINSKQKDLAWQFIKFITGKESNKRLAMESGVLPIWKDLYTDASVVAAYPYLQQLTPVLAEARGLTTVSWYDDFVAKVVPEVRSALAGTSTPQEALSTATTALATHSGNP